MIALDNQAAYPPSLTWAFAIPGIIAAIAAAYTGVMATIRLGNQDKVLASVKFTGEATHTLSNSAMGAQLQLNMATLEALSVVLHRIAATSGSEADLAAATAIDVRVMAARKLLQDHLTKQAVVDAQEKNK